MTSTELAETPAKPLVGIGSCLAGNEVRYNGQAKSPNQYVKQLSCAFETRPFCPEMGIGMGVPRPPIHLVGDEQSVRVLDVASHSNDYTDQIRDFASRLLDNHPGLCGYILVKGSPSCGYERVKRFNAKGNVVAHDQQGVFAATLGKLEPLLPLEDDGRLHDPALRESFVTRVYVYQAWKALINQGIDAKGLIAFYSRHKYLLMAHHPASYKVVGKLLANAGKENIEELSAEFITLLMNGLSQRSTRRTHSNVLFHLAGYLKRSVASEERQRLSDLIEQYRVGNIPLIVPITMLKHHFSNHPDAYIQQQTFMEPFPDELQLRNLV